MNDRGGRVENQRTVADGIRLGLRALVYAVLGGAALLAIVTVASVLGPMLALDFYTPPVAAWWTVFTAITVQGVPFLLLARRDVDLSRAQPADRTLIVRALSVHLRRRASVGRAALLEEVAKLAPLLRALNEGDELTRTATAIRAVTTDWHW